MLPSWWLTNHIIVVNYIPILFYRWHISSTIYGWLLTTSLPSIFERWFLRKLGKRGRIPGSRPRGSLRRFRRGWACAAAATRGTGGVDEIRAGCGGLGRKKCDLPPKNWFGWWFGTFLLFPYIGNFIIPTDFHIFERGWNHQPVVVQSQKVDKLHLIG